MTKAEIWQQVRNLTATQLINALEKDSWKKSYRAGSSQAFVKDQHHPVVIHFHPGKTYGPKQLKAILKYTGWTESDYIRLRLIKAPHKKNRTP